MTAKIGIFGGTFDPVHLGHAASALDVGNTHDLDTVLMVLSARPPHRPDHTPAPTEHRLAMLELACRDAPLIEPCDIECRRPGLSYMVETLEALREENPGAELSLILGIDAYLDIDSWYRPEDLPALANLIVTSRPGHEIPPGGVDPPIAAAEACCYDPRIGCTIHTSGHTLRLHQLQAGVPVSATKVRARLADGQPVNDMVGDAVAEYIDRHGLYAS